MQLLSGFVCTQPAASSSCSTYQEVPLAHFSPPSRMMCRFLLRTKIPMPKPAPLIPLCQLDSHICHRPPMASPPGLPKRPSFPPTSTHRADEILAAVTGPWMRGPSCECGVYSRPAGSQKSRFPPPRTTKNGRPNELRACPQEGGVKARAGRYRRFIHILWHWLALWVPRYSGYPLLEPISAAEKRLGRQGPLVCCPCHSCADLGPRPDTFPSRIYEIQGLGGEGS